MSLKKILGRVAEFQVKYSGILLVIVLLITTFMLVGVPNLELESDMAESMPQQLPIYQLNNKISEKYGAQDVILVVLHYDDNFDSKNIDTDIRSVEVVSYLQDLEKSLLKESSIDSVMSIASVFNGIELTQDNINYILKTNPELQGYFSDDLSSTFLMVTSDIGGSEQKTNAMVSLIDSKLNSYSIPAGLSLSITGTPPMRITMTQIMGSDAVYTLIIASILIFLLLVILERSIIKAILISTPLAIGLLWTMGTLGWIGLKISMATAGLGAMILGLGVEYGVFMLKRYHEEREKNKGQVDSLKVSVPAVGKAILGSGLTTTTGFLALTLSIIPMMQNLGLSLAIGIIYCLISSIFIAPVIYVIFEKGEYKFEDWLFNFVKKKEDSQHEL